jgi:predicted Zn-dependent protease
MKSISTLAVLGCLVLASPAAAQFGRITDGLQKAKEAKSKIDELNFTDAEEQELGGKVSGMLRQKYGVVQDPAVHKYVTLEGLALAQASSRPNLSWTFIVLDTDGVNAFAAPGGLIHITRGALALIQNEAELAGVLGHEISHVTAKHTIHSIQKNKAVQMGAEMTKSKALESVANRAYEMLLENSYDRGDEMDADKNGLLLANKIGYVPTGLNAFLSRLAERNKDLKDRSGLFASHPETQARLDALTRLAAAQKPAGAATVGARFHTNVTFKPVPVAQVANAAGGSTAPQAAEAAGKSKFGLSSLKPGGGDKANDQTVASAGSRGVNPDRDAKGGPNKALVTVTVTPADVADFRKGIV